MTLPTHGERDGATRCPPRAVIVYGRYTTTSYLFIHALGRLLSRRAEDVAAVHFHLFLDDRRDEAEARRLLPADRVTVRSIYRELRPFDRGRTWPAPTVRQWERRYGAPHLRRYIASERALGMASEATKWRYLLSHIDYLEARWRELEPVLFVTGAAEGLLPWVAMAIASAHDTPCLSFSPSRFGARSFILDNPYETLHIRDLYQRKLRDGLTPAEVKETEALIAGYRAGAVKPVDHLAARGRQRRRVINPFSLVRIIRDSCFTDIGNADLPVRAAIGRAVIARRTALRNALLSRHARRAPASGERFFFFPLQFEPEISLATQGRGWTNQRALIRLISHCLPIDRFLYVKEHPSMLSGVRPLGFYRDIVRLPRVRLLHQDVKSHDIVAHAEAVLTITGTAGWEALMHRRPVVLFGRAFYEEFEEGVVRLDRPEDLGRILRGLRERDVPESALRAYVAAVLDRAAPGVFIEPRTFPSMAGLVLGDENLDNIAAIIASRLRGSGMTPDPPLTSASERPRS